MFRVADTASALLDFCRSLRELVTLRDVSRLPGNHAYGLCQSETSPRRSRGPDCLWSDPEVRIPQQSCTNLRQDPLEDLVCGHAQTGSHRPFRWPNRRKMLHQSIGHCLEEGRIPWPADQRLGRVLCWWLFDTDESIGMGCFIVVVEVVSGGSSMIKYFRRVLVARGE
jgi:hypothetical protein